MRYLKTTKNIGDQVTRYQLEADRLERQDKSFDFFKYASRSKIREETVYRKCLARTTTSFLIFIPS